MKISAVDQLTVIDDSDSYASAMGTIYPVNGGNAQYYEANAAGVVTRVSPEFADADGKRLIFFPMLFSAAGQKYLSPTGTITFRFNNSKSEESIIAQGTMEQFANGTAVVDKTWSTAAQGKAQSYAQVFKATTYTITNPDSTQVTMPALAVIGQLPYRTKNDMSIYCTCEVGDNTLSSKGDIEIRSMTSDNYKVVITAINSAGANDQVINSSDETITLTAALLKNGTSDGVAGQTYSWHLFGDSTVLGTDQSLVVGEIMVGGVAEFVCDVHYGNDTYSGTVTINDIQDQYMIEKGRVVKNGSSEVENSGLLKPSYTVYYTPSVVDKRTGAAYAGSGTWTYTYLLKNAAGRIVKPNGDVATGEVIGSQGGVDLHDDDPQPISTTFTVQATSVKKAGGMTVIINALNSSI